MGNGSDEVLAFAFAAFFDPAKPVLFADITYSFYKVYAEFYGLQADLIPLDEQFRIPLELFNTRENGGIVIPNPNAPTAMLVPVDEFRLILEHNRNQVVIIDEAYIDFGGETAVKLVADYPNVLVIQTLSKSRSLAGLRVGWAIGSEELIDGLNRVKNSFNSYTIDRLALAGAVAAIEDEEYFQDITFKVNQTREQTAVRLRELGFVVTDSTANFLFISHPDQAAETIFGKLREQGVLVRYFKQPRIDQYLRVSIGTDEEMDVFLNVIADIVKP